MDRKGVPELEQRDEAGQGDIEPQPQNHAPNRNDDSEPDGAAPDRAPGPGDGKGPQSPPTRLPGAD
ncbi:MAG: hypothetical protein WDM79_16225 [Terricaulis sp.]